MAWAVSIATEKGKLCWLLLCAVLVGMGFNIKMLQAFLVLPALFLLYLVAAPLKFWKRVGHLALATLVLLVVSCASLPASDWQPGAGSQLPQAQGGSSGAQQPAGQGGPGGNPELFDYGSQK